MRASAKLDDKDLRRVSVAGDLDPRTVRKALDGRAVTSASLRKVKRGLRRCGLAHLLPENEVAVARSEAKVAAAERRAVRRLVRSIVATPSPFTAHLVERRAAERLNPRRADKE